MSAVCVAGVGVFIDIFVYVWYCIYAMKKTMFEYNIIVEQDVRTGSTTPCFAVYCPSLGLSDSGDTIEEAVESMKKTIEFHLQCVAEEGNRKAIIPDSVVSMFTRVQVALP